MPIDIPFYRTANFDQGISPCSDYDQPSTYTISVGGGYYYYSCRPDVCKDPGIAVRSNTDVQNQGHRKVARTATKGPEIYCEETTKTLKLDPPSETANVGEGIAWIGLGIQQGYGPGNTYDPVAAAAATAVAITLGPVGPEELFALAHGSCS